MSTRQVKTHESNDTKLIEIHTRLFYFDKIHILEIPEFVSVYNDSGKVIGAGFLKQNSVNKCVDAILTFDYHSPERLSIELNDGYKYYAHPIMAKTHTLSFGVNNKLSFVLINTQKHEDERINYLKV